MAVIEIRKFDTSGNVLMVYKLRHFKSFGVTINTPVTPTPLPQTDSADQILVKIEGNSTSIKVSWIIKEYANVNQITGPGFNGNSSTVIEQILGIKNQFRPVLINDSYEIAIVDGGNDLISWKGTISQIPVNFTDMSPVTATASITFFEGTVVVFYSSDGPKQPTNVTANSGDNGEIDMTWTNPTDTGTSNPSLNGFRIQYRTGNNDWSDIIITTGANTTYTITGLISGEAYQVKVAATTINGAGAYSPFGLAIAG